MSVLADVPVATELPELHFIRPMAGLGETTRFALAAIDELGVLFSLNGLDDPAIRLVVAAPGAFFPDYAPEIDDQSVAALGINEPRDARLLVVLTVGPTLSDSTANLLAPVVVNIHTLAAAQVVLDTLDLPVRAALAA